jgi:transcriptional regulator NrdR family protein
LSIGIDKIAYVRFAPVYRDFQDEQPHLNELKSLKRHSLGVVGERSGRIQEVLQS